MDLKTAKSAIDKVIDKARVHLYKPIQIAEILYRDRVSKDIDVADLESYRSKSKAWRDIVCIQFLGRTSTSSARFQDDLFNDNAVPPALLRILAEENKAKDGIVEAYIYRKFFERFNQMNAGLAYCLKNDKTNFEILEFIDLFWAEPGLRRSVDKIYEIIVYSLFSSLIEALEVSVEISMNPEKAEVFEEFKDFAKSVIQMNAFSDKITISGKLNRVGVTNAADRGLDMWANFGMAIQIKHLSLTEEVAENIVSSVTADRIVIVCKESEKKTILSLLGQIGWKSRIQSIITENDLVAWYEKALRGKYADAIGDKVIANLQTEIANEFPATKADDFLAFYNGRKYHPIDDPIWEA